MGVRSVRHASARRSSFAVLAALALLAGACDGSGAEDATDTSTTVTTSTSSIAPPSTSPRTGSDPDAPGALLSSEEIDAPEGATAWRITYRSTSVEDRPVEVSGVVLAPAGEPPAGGWPVLAWAHGTTGVADVCAPSTLAGATSVPQATDWLEAGYVIAATDYEGLGTPGVHPYLVLESEGRSVLDSVRAARALVPDTSPDVAIVGHSQGGHAALAAAEIALDWAPELELTGTVALAPAADLEAIVPAVFSLAELFGFGVLVAAGWADAYDELELTDVLAPAGVELAARADEACLITLFQASAGRSLDELVTTPPGEVPAWAALIAENSIHPERVPGRVLIVQGDADTVIPPVLSERLMDELCAAGADVGELIYEGADHGAVVARSQPDVEAWLRGPASAPGAVRGCARR